jgi:hypothetical protein
VIVTLSERRLSELIRQLEGINDSDSEIAFRMQYFASRIFKHVEGAFGIKMVGLVEHQGDIGSFRMDISKIGREWNTRAQDFDWQKLIGGLQFLNALAVSIECIDMEHICSGIMATSASDAFDNYEHELQRLSVSEVRPKIEDVLLKYVWNATGPQRYSTGNADLDRHFDEQEFQSQLERAGDPNSLKLLREMQKQDEIDSYRQAEIDKETERQKAAAQERYDRIVGGN